MPSFSEKCKLVAFQLGLPGFQGIDGSGEILDIFIPIHYDTESGIRDIKNQAYRLGYYDLASSKTIINDAWKKFGLE